jgi:hypothetical protein
MRRAIQILVTAPAAALLIWPALVNGYPLLYPDSLDYLWSGRGAWLGMMHTYHPGYNALRSAIYSAAVYLFYLGRTPWPILLLNVGVVVFTVALVTRSLVKRNAWSKTLVILAALGMLTGLSWQTSFLMPDVLGAPLYLAIYLFVFARETLRPPEQIALAALAIFCATAHTSHLLLATGLCAGFWLLQLAPRVRSAVCLRNACIVTVIVAAAICLQLGVNNRLYGIASLAGGSPPFVEARILSDGTGARYLREHFAEHKSWVLVHFLDRMPANEEDFLWSDNGIWSVATYDEQDELQREQWPLVIATVRAYPGQQAAISLRSFRRQLTKFALDYFHYDDYTQTHLNAAIPNGRSAYDSSLQAHNALPQRAATIVQLMTVIASLLIILASLPGAIRRRGVHRDRLLALTGVVVAAVLSNAFICGVLSGVDPRYQARVIWLIPLLGAFYLLELPIFARPVE